MNNYNNQNNNIEKNNVIIEIEHQKKNIRNKKKENKIIIICIILIILFLFLSLLIGLTSKKEKNTIVNTTTTTVKNKVPTRLIDKLTGISITFEDDKYLSDNRINVVKLENINIENSIMIYDINIIDENNNVIKVNDINLIISIPYNNINNYTEFKILYLDDKNSVIDTITPEYVGGNIVFSVSHLSRYAVVVDKKVNETTTTTKKTTNKTTIQKTTNKTTIQKTTNKTTIQKTTKTEKTTNKTTIQKTTNKTTIQKTTTKQSSSTNIISYSIDYNLNGGYGTNPSTYNINNEKIELKAPYRYGYMFDGWTGSNGDEKQIEVTLNVAEYGNKKYIANWKPYNYTLNNIKENGSKIEMYLIGEISSYKIDDVYGNWVAYKIMFNEDNVENLKFSYKNLKNVLFKKNQKDNYVIAYIDFDKKESKDYNIGSITYTNGKTSKNLSIWINIYSENSFVENYDCNGELIPFSVYSGGIKLEERAIIKNTFYCDEKTNRLYYTKDAMYPLALKDNKSFKMLSIENNKVIEKEIIGYMSVPSMNLVEYYIANDKTFIEATEYLLDNYRYNNVEIHYFFNRNITQEEQNILNSLENLSNVVLINEKDKWFK